MARLPLIQAAETETRQWLTPSEIRQAFRMQPVFVLPDCASLRWTLVSTFIPGMLFLYRVLPRATEDRSWSRSCCVLWALGATLGFVAAACLNPGVVPRAAADSSAWASVGTPPRYLTVNGVLVRQRWCNTCRVHRPLRSKHCSHCDRCVFRFDHHCTWLGNCVGMGNYRAFLLLVVAASLFYGHSMTLSFRVLRLVLSKEGAWRLEVLRGLLLRNWGATVYFLYSLVMFFAFLVLLLYHVIIVSCNLTTNEHVRDYYIKKNPYDVACSDNCRQVLCAPYGRPVSVDFDLEAAKPKSNGASVGNGK